MGYSEKELLKAYNEAKANFEFFHREIIRPFGYSTSDAIAAAQYYGRMTGLARFAEDAYGITKFMKEINEMDVKLFPSDYES